MLTTETHPLLRSMYSLLFNCSYCPRDQGKIVRRLELLVSMACYFVGTEGNIITYFGDWRANFIFASNVKERKIIYQIEKDIGCLAVIFLKEEKTENKT